MRYGKVTITTSPTLILSAADNRHSVVLFNSSTLSASIGHDNQITTDTALPLTKSTYLAEDSGGAAIYKGDYYGVASAGTADIYYWERTR